jgi:hypothetical protein
MPPQQGEILLDFLCQIADLGAHLGSPSLVRIVPQRRR